MLIELSSTSNTLRSFEFSSSLSREFGVFAGVVGVEGMEDTSGPT